MSQRERLPHDNADDIEDREEDQPTVVVLKPGDLTAEEASAAAAQKKKGKKFLFVIDEIGLVSSKNC